jgi:uncharacterized membrane protein
MRRAGRRERAVVLVLAVIVVAGCTARFVNLERHFYFHDEAATSLILSGRTSHEFELAASRSTSPVESLRRFQHVGEASSLATVVRHLGQRDPQHPPLFYAVARLWSDVFGDSIRSLRALAALFSVLALPCVFWLALELFESAGVAAIAVALTAASPFQLLYAQEAREYSLWFATVALAGAALLFALRRGGVWAWLLYAASAAAVLYSFTLGVLVLAGHALYVGLLRADRGRVAAFAVAGGAAVVAFVPWLVVVARNRAAFDAGTDWTSSAVSFAALAKSWLVVLVDGVVDKRGDTGLTPGVAILFAAVLALQLVALALLWKGATRKAAQFVTILVAASFVPLALLDLVAGGQRSIVQRFVAPVYLGLTLALAFLLWTGARQAGPQRWFATAVGVFVIACGAVSYAHEVGRGVWWNQDDGATQETRAVARLLNRAGDEVFLMAAGGGALLELTNYLRPHTQVRLVLDGAAPEIPARARHVFAYGSPATPTAAERLRRLLSDLRSRGMHVRPIHPRQPCCGAGIRPLPNQLWVVDT